MDVRIKMRIDSFQHSQNVGDSEQVSPKQDKKPMPPQAPVQDSAQLSAHLQEKLAKAPEVRQERVTAIKQAMDAGTYKVSDSQLADAMFKEFFKRG
jgi:flagellar biosynthesis anti-sigma factor FlgM